MATKIARTEAAVDRVLQVVMYHYVRDLSNTRYPRLKAMALDDFTTQLSTLPECFEMATLASALAFLNGEYTPDRDLCLLTFDDGLKEHAELVTPLLAERGIQGLFFPITSCLDGRTVAPVHMNHFLTAELGEDLYYRAFRTALRQSGSACSIDSVDPEEAIRIYRWDSTETARFKYMFNFVLEPGLRNTLVRMLFSEHISSEAEFAEGLYLRWDEARQMQEAGMVIGGHSHSHQPLSNLSAAELDADIQTCSENLRSKLLPQAFWPFSYPYGKRSSFSPETVRRLKDAGFDCAFTTIVGSNGPGHDSFSLERVDCKDADTLLQGSEVAITSNSGIQ